MDNVAMLAREHLRKAADSEHGRSAHLFLHEGPLRQTVIALTAGSALDEHNAPVAASIHVLVGAVRITTPEGGTDVTEGQIEPIPQKRHGLTALEDAAILLTAVTEVAD